MSTTLSSSDPSMQVRKARVGHRCYGHGRDWQSVECRHRMGQIRKGSTYVAKIARRIVAGRWAWAEDLRHYCSYCAVDHLPAITQIETKVA